MARTARWRRALKTAVRAWITAILRAMIPCRGVLVQLLATDRSSEAARQVPLQRAVAALYPLSSVLALLRLCPWLQQPCLAFAGR